MGLNEAIAMLGIAGLILAIGSQIWLLILMMRCSVPMALLAFVIPFWTWVFAIQNWDIAKRTFLCQIAGLVLFFGVGAVIDHLPR